MFSGSNASSDNDQDELMEDVDDHEPILNGDDAGDDDEEDDGEEDQEDEDDDDHSHSVQRASHGNSEHTTPTDTHARGPTSQPNPSLARTSASPARVNASGSPRLRFELRAEALSASSYDIVPTIAAPQSTSINAIAATPDMRFWFTGGSDCFVRKYDGNASINGKTLLTVAQRHPFVDSVVKAGVLLSYCDNEEPVAKSPGEEAPLSPVYSLAVQRDALWLLSGLESGSINLYSVRHDEGKRITSLRKHTSAVSVLTMARDERSVLSGSWDKHVHDWDLNTGAIRRSFQGSGGQISAIEVRPASSLPVPAEAGEERPSNATPSGNGDQPVTNGALTNGIHTALNGLAADEGTEDAPGDTDSLFGDGPDSLFGDPDTMGAPSGGNFGDDDEFSKALGMANRVDETADANGDMVMGDSESAFPIPPEPVATSPSKESQDAEAKAATPPRATSLPKAEDVELPTSSMIPKTQDAEATSESTFLAASIDGSIRVWDRRQPNPVATIRTRTGVPPWCMAACWSQDGNAIYAGRRNGTVEVYDLHKGLRSPERTLKFPAGSNAVTALRAMPNGRHLIWYVDVLIFTLTRAD